MMFNCEKQSERMQNWEGCECLQNDVLVKIGLATDILENSSRRNKLCFGFLR